MAGGMETCAQEKTRPGEKDTVEVGVGMGVRG